MYSGCETFLAGELEQYFKTTFPGVNYSKKHKEVLEKLLKNNSLEYIKKYLSEQWEYVQNDKNILNKSASALIYIFLKFQ